MTTTTTTQVTCPMHDGTCGEQVAAHGLADFFATTVKVDACTALLAQGWTGPQWVGRKTQAERFAPQAAPVLRHSAGLVTFG